VGTPVIANAQSRVLADHCRKANAGLYYGDFEEFEEVLTLLLNDRNLGRSLGRNGQTYVKDNYGWNRLLPKYELVFRSSARPAREPRGARGRPSAASSTGAPHEPEDLVSTGDLPLLEPEPDGEPVEAHAEELETAESYSDEPETAERTEEFDELAPEERDYAKAEEEDEKESFHQPLPEPAGEAQSLEEKAASEESPLVDDGELPAFYRPRQRPIPKAPEPAKED
jgi:hypothetical protein